MDRAQDLEQINLELGLSDLENKIVTPTDKVECQKKIENFQHAEIPYKI